jgi:hypothetical protein
MTHASLIDENLRVAVMSNIGFCGRANRSKKIKYWKNQTMKPLLEEPNHGTLTSFIIIILLLLLLYIIIIIIIILLN